MPDQLIQLALDDQQYMENLRRIRGQTTQEFGKMRRSIEGEGTRMSNAIERGLGGVKALARIELLRKGVNLAKVAMGEYAKTTAEAAAEVGILGDAWERFSSNAKKVGGAAISKTLGVGQWVAGQRGEFLAAGEQKAAADAAAADLASRQAARKADREFAERIGMLRADFMPNAQGKAARAMIEAQREERALRERFASGQYGGRADQLQAEIDAVHERTSATIAEARREAEAERVKAASDAREARADTVEKADAEWKKFIDDSLARESEITEQLLGDAEAHAEAMHRMREEERSLKIEALRMQGKDAEAQQEEIQQRRDNALRNIRMDANLSDAERRAAEQRIGGQYDELSRGVRSGGYQSLESIASGTAGFQSVLAGAFGGMSGGGGPQVETLRKIESSAAASAKHDAKAVQLLTTIATKIGPAVYA